VRQLGLIIQNVNSGAGKKAGAEAFWARVDDIARARLDAAEDNKLHLKAADTLHRELLQELDRYGTLSLSLFHQKRFFFARFPLVERAVADVPALADPEFVSGIRKHAESLVLLRRSSSSRSRGDTATGKKSFSPILPHFCVVLIAIWGTSLGTYS
jgi:hypothetical protein